MQRRPARFVLPVLMLALLASFASRPAAAEERLTPAHPVWLVDVGTFNPAPQPRTFLCYVWIGTDYFSDAAETNRVGVCTVTCYQAEYGFAEPTFTGGGTCSGTSGPYTLRRSYGCPGVCP